MKTFVYAEGRQPDLVKRREILENLARLKKYPEMSDLKRLFRVELRKTFGYKNYFLFHKGVRIFIGDQYKVNKFISPFTADESIRKTLKAHRSYQKTILPKSKSIVIPSLGMGFNRTVLGGVGDTPDQFFKMNKQIRSKRVFTTKTPKSKDTYIGIELEYASAIPMEEIADLIADAGLHNKLKIMRDGSISVEAAYRYQVEFCLLTTLEELPKDLEKMQKFLIPELFKANPSCGFHVHLDARHKDPKKIFHNLVCMQSLLFSLVDEHRQDNRYCKPMSTPNFDDVDEHADHAHWDAISKYSFFKHRTIEVRIHQSTINLTTVLNWVKLLRKIADYEGEPLNFGSHSSTLKQLPKIGLDDGLMTYLKEKRAV